MYKISYIIIILLMQCNNLCAKEIDAFIVLKSKNTPIHTKIADAFRNLYKDKTKIIELEGDENKGKKFLESLNPGKKQYAVIAIGPEAVYAANMMLKRMPIVFCMVSDAECKKIIKNSNIYGISNEIPIETRLEAIKSVFPKWRKIGIIYNPQSGNKYVENAAIYGKKTGIDVITFKVNSETEIYGILKDLNEKVDVLLVIPDNTVITKDSIKFILVFSKENRCPIMGFTENEIKGGALIAVESDTDEIVRQAVKIIENFRKEQSLNEIKFLNKPEKFRTILNLKAAQNIGVAIPLEIIKTVDLIY
ncbi:hypothetical protein HZA55_02420 [Candidatus Poribacteria bacterium]|nr:hypothetical protein [Candidatus Poribacteria bacterium]